LLDDHWSYILALPFSEDSEHVKSYISSLQNSDMWHIPLWVR